MPAIYPSLISANLLNLESEIKRLAPYCPGFHLDIMDNHFVPNITWGAQFANAIATLVPNKVAWVHIMATNPLITMAQLSLPEKSIISFHKEIDIPTASIVKEITARHWIPSIAIKPKTPLQEVLPLLDSVLNHVLVMSVEPGFSGQLFLDTALKKIAYLNEYRTQNNLSFSIGVDGGINQKNIIPLLKLSVDDFAIASAIFSQPDPVAALKRFNHCITDNQIRL